MKSEINLDLQEPEATKRILDQSLDTDSKVKYGLKASDKLQIRIETESIGPLRGSTDTAFRLAMLTEKIRSR